MELAREGHSVSEIANTGRTILGQRQVIPGIKNVRLSARGILIFIWFLERLTLQEWLRFLMKYR
jgi:hypothetical protein